METDAGELKIAAVRSENKKRAMLQTRWKRLSDSAAAHARYKQRAVVRSVGMVKCSEPTVFRDAMRWNAMDVWKVRMMVSK